MTTKCYLEEENDYCVLLADLIIDQYIESKRKLETLPTIMNNKLYNEDTKDE